MYKNVLKKNIDALLELENFERVELSTRVCTSLEKVLLFTTQTKSERISEIIVSACLKFSYTVSDLIGIYFNLIE